MSSIELSSDTFMAHVKARHSYYTLKQDISPMTDDKIDKLVAEAIQAIPSPYNSQSNRVILLRGPAHEKLWDIAAPLLRGMVPEDLWTNMVAGKVAAFRRAAGTILFFEDQDVVKSQQEAHPMFAGHFPTWATQSDAMLQFALWTALEAEGLGANLQHHTPLLDDAVAKEWDVPASWKLNAQMVFGGRDETIGAKPQNPIEEKLKIFSA